MLNVPVFKFYSVLMGINGVGIIYILFKSDKVDNKFLEKKKKKKIDKNLEIVYF
jgi:hypothetical protein